ncbi:serine hydrolase domain-containing protein [Maricaulis parjimensis]|uniref:serine hydrolase domain-containing protein n=1 Tax=Maricaulis parjimensis TaxID=144023 RepID=UPI00193A27BD|nr:serine hydrolase domain-containing protein [Maricaulis parjimensis]
MMIGTMLGLALGLQAAAASEPEPVPAQLETFMAELVESGQYEGAIHIVSADGPLIDRAYGHADVEQSRANTPDMRFHIASITKAFTATLVLGAMERGELSLEDPAARWIPELDAEQYGDVTLRHLLEHTSGLMRDHTEALGGADNSPEAMIEALNSVGPQSVVGELYNYSNSGYALLALVLERATGETYADLLQDRILTPAGLAATSYGLPGDPELLAVGLDMPDLVSRVPVDPTSFRGGLPGASGIFSTARDLVRFGQALEHEELLSVDSLAIMLAGIEAPGSDGTNSMGWMRVGLGDESYAWAATGASDGYLSLLMIDNLEADVFAASVQNNTRAGRSGSVGLLLGVIYITELGSPESAAIPPTPLDDFLSALNTVGVEAARDYRDALDMSRAPVASAADFQALGEPDGGVGETSLAWAPATADAGAEWLELGFPAVADARYLDIHFTQIPDALQSVRLSSGVVLDAGAAVRLTSEAGAPIVRFALAGGTGPDTVRLELETAQTPGWPQIDAVALIDAADEAHWAISADASTSAFLSGGVAAHDLPSDAILGKLASQLDAHGHDEMAGRVRAFLAATAERASGMP